MGPRTTGVELSSAANLARDVIPAEAGIQVSLQEEFVELFEKSAHAQPYCAVTWIPASAGMTSLEGPRKTIPKRAVQPSHDWLSSTKLARKA